ncbi:GNAT family N-acetyltransferase [Bacillus mangrovi]|uniref:GNAT family N-acetyltransferase n=1 Tax=Metabacillus mangrovi TaxID=1491830 RepID=A0A7X2V5V1_9BACI|nr:GNAT family N-acetyltransferase [Metabacillus mangrovi]
MRKADPQDLNGIAQVHVDSWRTAYRGLIDEDYLQSITYESKRELWAKADLSQVIIAEDEEGRIVGFSGYGRERTGKYGFDSEIYAIYILEEVQRKGIGSALLLNTADDMLKKGWNSALVWVLRDNPSRAFYESYFPELAGEEQCQIGTGEFTEYAYGWKDLERLKAMLLQGNR